MGRKFLLLIVVLGLAPGTWVRITGPVNTDDRQILTVERLDVPRVVLGNGIELAGAWQLNSPNRHFSGYSALLPMGDGTLLALSDNGRQLRFAQPGAEPRPPRLGFFASLVDADDRQHDLEAATRDPASGRLWTAYERSNHIERYDREFVPTGVARPAEMDSWRSNDGPEAMARLDDGRFVVLAEGNPRWLAPEVPGLLFRGDPVAGVKPMQFRFRGPGGYAPVDMAELPDGRILILLRTLRWRLPPRFEGKLVVADPAAIASEEPWAWEELADLAEPLPMDNYEGLAIERGDDGRLVLWLISDDNRASFQRTLLLKLLWQTNKKARELPRAPR